MRIHFNAKFTSKDLSAFIQDYYEKSLVDPEVIFSLKKLEWIAVEELTFLFGWIRHVKKNNKQLKKISIELPEFNPAESETFISPREKDETIRRRRTRLISLVENWKIVQACGLTIHEVNFEEGLNMHLGKKSLSDNNWHSIIPFKPIPFVNYHSLTELRENVKSEVQEKFKLQARTNKLLTDHTSRSIFDNKTLSNIITTELYLNSLHHSFPGNRNDIEKECYFSVSLRNKIDIEKYIDSKQNEGVQLTKQEARKKIEEILAANARLERLEIERSFFEDSFTGEYRNESYIEFSFMDLGIGIPDALRERYHSEMQDPERVVLLQDQLSERHFKKRLRDNTEEDSLILEYSFLLHSSSNPFDTQLKINDFVPRGLFFLIDMVKRYNGMVLVRSKKGAIAYSFSAPKRKIKDCVSYSRENNNYFPGTMISIYIPADSKENKVKINAVELEPVISSVRQHKRDIKYISVSDIYRGSRPDVANDENFVINRYYYQTFQVLNNTLDLYSKSPSLIIVDFTGCDFSVIDHKIYYYLSNTPKVNSNTSLVIINRTDKNIIRDVQKSIQYSDDLLFRPIPCLVSKDEVIWIGIKHPEDEKLLNKLWLFPEQDSEGVGVFKNADQLTGNVIQIEWIAGIKGAGNVRITIPARDKVFNYYLHDYVPKEYIKQILLQEEKHKVLQKEVNTVYWTSGGYYQTEFIRFIEKLYEVNMSSSVPPLKYANDFDFSRRVSEQLLRKYELYIGELDFDYIVSVTLSSQLLASAVRSMYCEIKDIPKSKGPQVIRLANYYDFSSEKAFKRIEGGKKVLIVNDVISTGKLSYDVHESLVTEQNAIVTGIFCLVDAREPENSYPKIVHTHVKSLEDKTVWLLKYPVKKYVDYTNIDTHPEYAKHRPDIISIDPVVNAPNTMSYERSDMERLIYSDASSDTNFSSISFLSKFKGHVSGSKDVDRLWVGHLHHNVAHHSYYFRLHKWFESQEGKDLIRHLVAEIKKKEVSEISDEDRIAESSLAGIEEQLRQMKSYCNSNKVLQNKYESVIKGLKDIATISIEDIRPREVPKDLILYPMYSGSEMFDKDDYREIFDIKEHSGFIVFPMGRVESPKGWRLTFPPKVLNEITSEYKHIFIIDDGTCTGETLMQMVDSVSFLHVQKITVLSVVGRLEDFQREFFTRINTIKIKDEGVYRIIPLRIYFGVHFHIPIYSAFTDICPFCEEERILRRELDPKNICPKAVEEYIKERLSEIRLFDSGGAPYGNGSDKQVSFTGLPIYIPQEIDRSKLFEYRDRIGKLASYRTYKEYLSGFDNMDWEVWIAILLHEPKLITIIEQLLPSLKRSLNSNIEGAIRNPTTLKYKWRRGDIVRFYSIIIGTNILKYEVLKKVIRFGSREDKNIHGKTSFEDTIRFIAYFLWKNLKFPEKKFRQLDKNGIILNFEKYWTDDVKPNEGRLREQGKGVQYDYLRSLLRHVMQLKDKSFRGNDTRYLFSRIKTFYLWLQADYPNHIRTLLRDFNFCLRKFQRISNILGNRFPLETTELPDAYDSAKTMLNDFNDSLLCYLKGCKDILEFVTPFHEKHFRENGVFSLYQILEQRINELMSKNEPTVEKVNLIIHDIEEIKRRYMSGDEEFAKFFIRHDPILCTSFDVCLDSFIEQNGEEMNRYHIEIDHSYRGKICEELTQVNIHPSLLTIVFNSLLNNTIKHTLVQYGEEVPDHIISAEFIFKKKGDFIEVVHTQNLRNTKKTGDGYAEIIHIMEHFGGSVKISDSTESFETIINIPISQLPIIEYYE